MLLPSDYANLFRTCILTTDPMKLQELHSICDNALSNRSIYEAASTNSFECYGITIPWPIIAAIHFRESSQNFNCHLHNGDPLTARTAHVPKGRPVDGKPPFTWPESAVDAFNGVWVPFNWDIAGCLQFMERYNGLGYQKHGVNSPYLWGLTNQYTSGLFVADGSFDPVKTDARAGTVAFLKILEEKGISLDFMGVGAGNPTLH